MNALKTEIQRLQIKLNEQENFKIRRRLEVLQKTPILNRLKKRYRNMINSPSYTATEKNAARKELNKLEKVKSSTNFRRDPRFNTISKNNIENMRTQNKAASKIQSASKIQAAVRGHQTREKYKLESMKNQASKHGLRALRQAFRKNPKIPIYYISAHGSICTPKSKYRHPNKKMTLGEDQWVVFFTKPGYPLYKYKNRFSMFMNRTPADFKRNDNNIKKWILNPDSKPSTKFIHITDSEVYSPGSVMWDTYLSFEKNNFVKPGFHRMNEKRHINVEGKQFLSDLLKGRGPGIFFVTSCRVSKNVFGNNSLINGILKKQRVTFLNHILVGSANDHTEKEYINQLNKVQFPLRRDLKLYLHRQLIELLRRKNLSNNEKKIKYSNLIRKQKMEEDAKKAKKIEEDAKQARNKENKERAAILKDLNLKLTGNRNSNINKLTRAYNAIELHKPVEFTRSKILLSIHPNKALNNNNRKKREVLSSFILSQISKWGKKYT